MGAFDVEYKARNWERQISCGKGALRGQVRAPRTQADILPRYLHSRAPRAMHLNRKTILNNITYAKHLPTFSMFDQSLAINDSAEYPQSSALDANHMIITRIYV
jgi:hypothetical protein